MPGPLDDALKHLTELSPGDWVVQGGWPAAPTTVIDADIATITGATDKALRVAGPPDWLLAVDFQAGHDTVAKLADLSLYNTALYRRHRLQVRSLLVLLHPGADSPRVTGLYERGFPDEPFDVAMRYRVLRVWQVPASQWLAGGLGLVPLAPLGEVVPEQLPGVFAQMNQRFEHDAPNQTPELWSSAYILMGLRYEPALVQQLLRGVLTMQESSTYRAIIAEGEARGERKEARKMLLLQGRTRFGEPSPAVLAALEAITDLQQLETLGLRILNAGSWQELLGLIGTN